MKKQKNNIINKADAIAAIAKGYALCFKPALSVNEALIYLDCGYKYLLEKAKEYGFSKNANGYYKKEDLDKVLLASPVPSADQRIEVLKTKSIVVKAPSKKFNGLSGKKFLRNLRAKENN